MNNLELYIECLIFACDKPITADEIFMTIKEHLILNCEIHIIINHIDNLRKKYEGDDFSIEIREIAGGYIFTTKKAYHDIIGKYLNTVNKSKLSTPLLETLAVIAYNQPVTKPEIENIRGVNSDFSIKKLLEKNIIEIKGREDGPGKPLIYVTNNKFLNYLGINELKDLPTLNEFSENQNSVGVIEEE